MLLNKKIMGNQGKVVLWNKAGIFKAIFSMQVTGDGTVTTSKVFGGDQDKVIDLQANGEVCSILKLVAHVGAKIRNVPTHAKRCQ
jgi:hypothetical protein